MDSTETSWWRRHVWTVVLLLTAFSMAILIRSLWAAQIIQQWGPLYVYGGGSDSFYHSRVSQYIVQNHANLVVDHMLRYPTGAVNPREPLFDWMNAILGTLFAGFFGGNATVGSAGVGAAWFLDVQGPIWAGLGVFPVYLIGREVSSRRMGIVAAFIYPLLVANIDSSTLGYANYLSFYTFFVLLTVYGFLRTVNSVGTRRWVESYRKPGQYLPALRQFLRIERNGVKWAVFTGVSLGTLALAWQGYSFAVATIVIFLVFAMIVERIRRVDSFGLYVSTWIVGLVAFPMAAPYFVAQGLFAGWFDLPLLIFFGALLVLLPFLVLRDSPWVVSVPVLVLVGGAAVGSLFFLNHSAFANIVTGQGYFVKTLVYSTVAEAQAPSVDALILGYGVVTFFLAFVGLALTLYAMIRGRFRRVHMLFFVFAGISIYLPISAAKFFFLGSAAFALLPAQAIVRALDVGSYSTLRRNVSSLADRRSQLTALRKSLKLRHFLIMILVVGILLPNVWYAVDAGIPYNSKSPYNQQIFDSLPPALRTSAQNATSFYLGAAGTQLDTPNQYDEAGYDWLAHQDQNLPPTQRPGFVSWWDYGFQAVSEGFHPTVADNFQNGIVPAGNFLLSQNESQAIGLLTTTLLQAEQKQSGNPYLPSALNQVLANDGVDLATLHTLLVNTSKDIPIVLAHPERYLAVDPSHLDAQNAMYDVVSYFLASAPVNQVAQIYNDVQSYTGWSIRYAMVDNRLFPFSGQNTGIFYAPADLTDRVIGAGGAPTTYYTLSALGSDGNTYPVNSLPPGVTAVQYNINWKSPFYNSMIYKIFIGYNGTQVGTSGGIPGLTGAASSDPIEPGWMLHHFQVVYRTAYYCPYANPSSHPGCFRAANLVDAVKNAHLHNGTADTSPGSYFQGGETMLEYYSGQTMTGTVQLPDGSPVPQARITVYDGWGIPHMTTLTDRSGAYTVILPPGNDTVNVTSGPVTGLTQAGSTSLATLHLTVSAGAGLSTSSPTMVRPVVLPAASVQGFVYWNAANNSTYIPHVDPLVSGASADLWGYHLTPQTATSDASGAFQFTNVPPGVYNFSVEYRGANYSQALVYALPGKVQNATTALSPGSVTGTVRMAGNNRVAGAGVTVISSTGVVAGSAVTNATGAFAVPNLTPGNYSVTASLNGLSSAPASASILRAGQKAHANLTLVAVETVDLTVVANGNPVAGFPVRFTTLPDYTPSVPALPPTNGSRGNGTPGSPGGTGTTPASTNSSLYITDSSGLISAVLPVGNYSVYGLGLVGSTLEAGFQDAYVTANPGGFPLPPLFVSPASSVGGSVFSPSSSSVPAPTLVSAFDARGQQVSTFSNSSARWAIWLPDGSYSILASQGADLPRGPLYATLAKVSVQGASQRLDLTLGPGTRLNALVGLPTLSGNSGYFPAGRAVVSVSELPLNATATVFSNSSGNVTLVLPSMLPAGATYCVRVAAFGFLPYSNCGIFPSTIGALTSLPLSIAKVPVSLTVVGLPSNARLTVNLTANSSTAQSVSATGGTSFQFTLRPGAYRISAFAPVPNGTGLYLPPSLATAVIPVGSQSTSITLTVVRQILSTGTLALPQNITNASVSLKLTSPMLNVSLGGVAFEAKFYAVPGTYQVYAAATVGTRSYATLTTATINATGKFDHAIDLRGNGTLLSGNLTQPSGQVLNATVAFTFVGPGGVVVPATSLNGRYSVLVPSGFTFIPSVSTTQLVPTPSGNRYEAFASIPGRSCTATGSGSVCNIPLTSTVIQSTATIELVYGTFPAPVPGTIRLVGPLPGSTQTDFLVANGTLVTPLLPGTYLVYATGGAAGVPLANVTKIAVPPASSPTATLVRLLPSWFGTVTVTPPNGTAVSSATVWFHAAPGFSLTFPGEPLGVPVSYILPQGVYTVQANASGNPFGVVTSATSVGSLALVSGNTAITLPLQFNWVHRVAFLLVGPTTATTMDGGWVNFAFSVRNTGNVPLGVRFIGTPSFWNFTFTPANVTLGVLPANNSASGEVRVHIPAGTAAAHPVINLEALVQATGDVAGFADPTPTIDILPYVGLTLGAAPASQDVIAPYSATVGFFALNTGNIPEAVGLSVSDAARLSGLGWKATIVSAKTTLSGAVILAPGSNQSYALHLVSPGGAALPPGSVTIVAHVLNLSGWLTQTIVLNIPSLSLGLNSTSLVVTGPSIGSPPTLPDWVVPVLAFVPALALLVGITSWRWYRSRRWTRR